MHFRMNFWNQVQIIFYDPLLFNITSNSQSREETSFYTIFSVLFFFSCTFFQPGTMRKYGLHREAAFNLSLIYRESGNEVLARQLLAKYCRVWRQVMRDSDWLRTRMSSAPPSKISVWCDLSEASASVHTNISRIFTWEFSTLEKTGR